MTIGDTGCDPFACVLSLPVRLPHPMKVDCVMETLNHTPKKECSTREKKSNQYLITRSRPMFWITWRSFRCIVSLILLAFAPKVLCFSPERTVVLLLYKSPNVVTSHVSHDDRLTVYDQVQDMTAHSGKSFEEVTQIRSKLHAIGRLDADTTGLLLITNDGGLVHHVTNKNALQQANIQKTYQALVMGHQTEDSLGIFWEGVDIGTKYGGKTLPVDDLKILAWPNHKSTLVELTISEGKNRQVRRMFHSIKSGVMQLKRVAIGASGSQLNLEGLQEGQWRILSEEEVRTALQWEPKIIEEKAVGRRRLDVNGSNGPKGQRASPPSDHPKGRRGRPSRKRRRRSDDSKSTNNTRTQRR